MKNIFLLTFLTHSLAFSQLMPSDIEQARVEHIKDLSDSTKGILNAEEIAHLGEITYYDYDSSFVINGTFTKSIGKKFKMITSTDRTPIYRRYGYVDFQFLDEVFRLEVYQNVELSKQKEYKKYLFVPFKDQTSAKETYGGGRYLDIQRPEKKETALDFNSAYNPYCAYSYRYSCPIPPKVNHLTIEIAAGEKTPTGH